jgi:twitching motility protein PilT
MILDPKLTGQLPEVVAEGGYYGMQTFDQHLLKHLQAGRITFDEAMRSATSPHDFKLMVAAEGSLSAVAAPAPAPEPPMTASFEAPSAAPPAASAPPPGMHY